MQVLSKSIHALALCRNNYIIALKDHDGFDPMLTNYNLLVLTDTDVPSSTVVLNDNS